jgi:hydroxymethylpyrimidine pyrophosphatase-like HAD family hydrolase
MLDIFFDIDGCLIDSNYSFTVNPEFLNQEFQNLISRGARIHINSNRSLDSILKSTKDLNYNGLIIFENGCGIYNPQNKKTENTSFKKINKDLFSQLGEVRFMDTDLLRNPDSFLGEVNDEIIYFCHKDRIYTMTIYPRVRKDLKLEVPFLDEIISRLNNILGDDFNYESSNTYGNIILTPKDSSKGAMMSLIIKNPSASFGDSIPDISMFEKTNYCGCPLNSQNEVLDYVKERKGFLGSEGYTKDAIKFLQEIKK